MEVLGTNNEDFGESSNSLILLLESKKINNKVITVIIGEKLGQEILINSINLDQTNKSKRILNSGHIVRSVVNVNKATVLPQT